MSVYGNIVELIGNTPILRLKSIENKYSLKSELYAKLEYFNPAGSIKDRLAKKVIEDAESKNLLKKGSVIVEPTSGNTGIGLASIAASKGYKVILTMPENMSVERIKLLKAYGAEIILTDKTLGMKGAIEKAEEILKSNPNAITISQFDNPLNPAAHYETTAVEIYNDLNGEIDAFVAGVGTGGTLTGVAKYLKERIDGINVIAVEPFNSPVLSGGKAGIHGLQGIGAGFIPKALDTTVYDKVVKITEEQAYNSARELAKTEGVLVGISSGAALYAAIDYAKNNENKKIVVILPDGGDKYLSTDLFE